MLRRIDGFDQNRSNTISGLPAASCIRNLVGKVVGAAISICCFGVASVSLAIIVESEALAQAQRSADVVTANRVGSEDDLSALLDQLESDSYAERQAASRLVSEIGFDATQPIVERMLSGRPESVFRCSRLLERIALDSNEREMTKIARMLLLLSNNGFDYLGITSAAINSRWKHKQLDRNVARLEEAGIQLERVHYATGGSGPDPFAEAWVVIEQNGRVANEAVAPTKQTRTSSPPLRRVELLSRVRDIVAATEEEDNRNFELEMSQKLTQATGSQTSVPPPVLRGGGVVAISRIPVQTVNVATDSFGITLGPEFKGGAENLRLLKLLPQIHQFTVYERDIDDELLKSISELTTVQQIAFQSCNYDIKSVLEVLHARPSLTITASGHETFMGVTLQTQTTDNGVQSCQILSTVADTAAEAAGCLEGDTIRRLDGLEIRTVDQMILAIGSYKPGDEVTVDILRGEEELELTMKLRKRPEDE